MRDHTIRRDRRRWIVQHPPGCRNAQRGVSGRVRETYLTTERGVLMEANLCGLPFGEAQRCTRMPQDAREVVVRTTTAGVGG